MEADASGSDLNNNRVKVTVGRHSAGERKSRLKNMLSCSFVRPQLMTDRLKRREDEYGH